MWLISLDDDAARKIDQPPLVLVKLGHDDAQSRLVKAVTRAPGSGQLVATGQLGQMVRDAHARPLQGARHPRLHHSFADEGLVPEEAVRGVDFVVGFVLARPVSEVLEGRLLGPLSYGAYAVSREKHASLFQALEDGCHVGVGPPPD